MRLLLLNWQDRLNPQAGGAEAHLREVFGRLAARGHSVTMLVSGWAGAPQRAELDGMEIHRTGSRYSFGVAAPRYYRRHLESRRFDLVVDTLNKVPLFAPVWAGRPVVLLVHHLFGATAFREAALPVAAATWLLERPLSAVYRGRPAEAISLSTRDDLVARGLRASDIRVIHPGVDLEYFTPGPVRAEVPTFVYLGRLRRYKAIDLILQALPRVLEACPEARLVIAGRGEYEPALRELTARLGLERAVSFAGGVPEEVKRELLRSAWAHVFTSPKEGWGMTNLEAAACGTPSIASDSPGLRESVREGESGLLVPHGDVPALASAMTTLARDREAVEELGIRARRFAEEFPWDAAADRTEAHLLSVLDAGATLAPAR